MALRGIARAEAAGADPGHPGRVGAGTRRPGRETRAAAGGRRRAACVPRALDLRQRGPREIARLAMRWWLAASRGRDFTGCLRMRGSMSISLTESAADRV